MTVPLRPSLLFLGKQDDPHCALAADFARKNFGDVTICLGKWGEPLPGAAREWEGDYVVSYLSRWVVPEAVMARAGTAAINFHPASPDYPGIGCNNFALYDNAPSYGATCHFMAAKVDTGAIIATKRFPVFAADDVESLLARTYAFQLVLFYEVVGAMAQGIPPVASGETWTRPPFTRKEFNELTILRPDMAPEEIARRIRATDFGSWKPTIEIAGFTFALT